jgi:hypothetical protein
VSEVPVWLIVILSKIFLRNNNIIWKGLSKIFFLFFHISFWFIHMLTKVCPNFVSTLWCVCLSSKHKVFFSHTGSFLSFTVVRFFPQFWPSLHLLDPDLRGVKSAKPKTEGKIGLFCFLVRFPPSVLAVLTPPGSGLGWSRNYEARKSV